MSENQRTLPRKPAAETKSVSELVLDVLDGRIRIPDWQRGFKWEREDARKLIDSLYCGYPVGTLLFWKRQGPAEDVRLGSVSIRARERSDALYVVDGQQRITSLVRVLAGAGAPDEEFALYFDLEAREVVAPRGGRVDPGWLPMTEVLDSNRLLEWLYQNPDADRRAAIELGSRIREYAIPAYVVESDEEGPVRDIFERINDTGKRLQASEVFDGRFRGIDELRPSGIRDVAEALDGAGFGRITDDQVLKMMHAMHFVDISKADTSGWSKERARAALDAVNTSAHKVLAFLRDDAGIPHRSYLPYSQPLLALARLFGLHPDPHARNRVLLARWVWRGAVAGLHSGAAVDTRAMLRAIEAGDEDGSVQRLLAQVASGRDEPFEPDLRHFRLSSARGKICAIALARLGPRHLATGEPLDLGEVQLEPIGEPGELRSSLGNRVLHPAMPGGLAKAIEGCGSAEVLASHEVRPEEARSLSARLDEVVMARERRLAARVQELVRRQTAWRDSDRPPLRALEVEDA